MTRVCFTGKGYVPDRRGGQILRGRATWLEMAEQMGWTIDATVGRGTTILVASTDSTEKARRAEGWGTEVITYDEFARRHVAFMAAGGVTVNGVDLDDPNDDGSLGYDPLADLDAKLDAAEIATRKEIREELEAERLRLLAEEEARAAEEEAIPGWGLF